MSSKTGTEVMFETYDKLQTLGKLREELFPCLLEGGLLEQINAQRKEAADEIERLREALLRIESHMKHRIKNIDLNIMQIIAVALDRAEL